MQQHRDEVRLDRCDDCASMTSGEIGLESGQAQALLGADLITDDEIVILLLRPSLLYIPLSSLGTLVVALMIGFALAYLARRIPSVGWTDTQALVLASSLIVIRLGWQTLEWYSRVYVLTDRRIIRRMGVLRYNVFEASLRNIQHTSIFATFRERVMGLGSIGLATSGSDFYDAYWVMIRRPHDVHRVVVNAIRKYGRRN